jgi:hypothetical protein
MQHRRIHRGVVALAIVTSLSVAGARPAAAANLGLLDRLTSLWSFVTGAPSPVPHAVVRPSNGSFTKSTSSPSTPTPDRGWGIDPNGNSSTSTPLPAAGNG